MRDTSRIKSFECRPGEPKEYCELREKVHKIEQSLDHIDEAEKLVHSTFFEGKEKYSDHLYTPRSDFVKGIEEAKKRVMGWVLDKEVTAINPNVKIDEKLNTEEIISQMDFKKLISSINNKYAAHEEITFGEILEEAKKLAYNMSVSKNKLQLEHYCLRHTKDYHTNRDVIEPYVYECAPRLIAFGKLTNIVIGNAKPSEADTNLRMLHNWQNYLFDGIHQVGDGSIKEIKFFKNGKLEVRFDTEEHAQKMEKVLRLL